MSKVLKWVLRIYSFPYPGSTSHLFALINRLRLICDSRGIESYIVWHKAVRTATLNYIAGTPKKVPGVRQTADGIPVILGDLIPLVRKGDAQFLRVLNTILFGTRAISIGKIPKFEPILDAPKGELPNISLFMGSFWKELGYFPVKGTPKAAMFKKYHLSTKSGPTGPNNAIGSAMQDLKALPSDLKDHLKELGGPIFQDYLFKAEMNLLWKGWGITASQYLRKLTYFPDREDKVRVVAIGDYWTQTVLKPLHEYLFKVLRKIPQDCTFNQGQGIEKIASTGEYYHSIDLTAATDRFPIKVISQLLAARFPKSYVDSWEHVMVGYPFWVRSLQKWVSYAVGNPMGFYSSWSSFALTHHYLLFYCCKILGKDWKSSKYVLLGDDIVIADKELASAYKEVITSLGVEFSTLKTYESKHFFEFAKRLWFKGAEISPFPMSALQECGKKYYLLLELFRSLEGKGWSLPNGPAWAVGQYMGEILSRPQRYVKVMEDKSQILLLIMQIIKGSEGAGKLLAEAFRILGHHFILSDFVARNVLENIIVDKFAESNPSDRRVQKEKGYTLHKALDQFLNPIDLEELLRDTNPKAPDHTLWHPVANVYSQLSEVLQDMSAKGLAISSSGGDWPLLMRTMALPWSDKIFVERSHHLIVRATAGLTAALEDRAQILGFYPPEELLRETP